MSGAIPSWARVGAKVVCVDARGTRQLEAGEIYEVAWVGLSQKKRLPMLGINGTTDVDGNRGEWKISRFRPLVTIEDDIATHFAEHLRQPRKIEVDA